MDWNKEFDEITKTKTYKQETLLLDFLEILSEYLRENTISKTELARKLNISNAAVSKLLKGNENVSIKRMASITSLLGIDITIQKKPSLSVQGFNDTPSSINLDIENIMDKEIIIEYDFSLAG
jgi:transcriptional regulator with XRE-family HTH domain